MFDSFWTIPNAAASPGWAASGLFVSAFVSATLLPGGSEVFLGALAAGAPDRVLLWMGAATLGNTLGSLTTYAMGRALPRPAPENMSPGQRRAYALAGRWGGWVLLFSWLPVVGDLLPAAAAWVDVGLWRAVAAIAAGKAARYALIVWAALSWSAG